MGVIKVPTTFNIEVEFEIPEFYRRLIALLIDMVVQFLYLLISQKIISLIVRGSDPFDQDTQHNLWAFDLLRWLPIMLYHIILEITMNGQSLGKKIMGMRVVSENGGRAGISQFIIRWLIRTGDYAIIAIILNVFILSNKELFVFLGASLILLLTDVVLVVSSRKNQRLGDILAHTILVRTKARGSMEETVFMEVADNYVPSFPEIMRLSDKDINAIKSILDTARKKGDFKLAAMASEKIKSHLKINSLMSPYDFLDTLLKDYNYLSVK